MIDLDAGFSFSQKNRVFFMKWAIYFLVSYEMSDYFFSYHFFRVFLISFPSLRPPENSRLSLAVGYLDHAEALGG